MIKLNNVNKYYNRKSSNQIHVINDFNYEFPDKGLVCLFGPSGCGKTSLLNAISGLDGIDSGEIEINNDKFTKNYRSNKWDSIRSKDIGYVFQSYVLFNDLTVYENLRFVLDVFGLDEEEIQMRIDYALNAVGMIKYKNRECNHLSGGQQQRVAIARALVKSPKIIVADEPTGNLDEKNTNIILNIIKRISKECLVILVTHEDRIAKFYADTIIYLKDGKIDYIEDNQNNNQLNLIDDKNIYLQELNLDKVINDNVNIDYFYQGNSNKINLKIVAIDNSIYIYNDNKKQKINLLSRDSETKLIDSKKPVITMEEVDNFEYEMPAITTSTHNPAISFKQAFKMTWNFITQMGKKQKMLIALMILSSIMVVVSFSSLTKSNYIDEKDYLTLSRDTTIIESKKIRNYDELQSLIPSELILPAPSISSYWYRGNNMKLFYSVFEQMKDTSYALPEMQILPVNILDDIPILHGRLPIDKNEITIDKWTLDLFLESNSKIYLSGFSGDYQDILNQNVRITHDGVLNKIVGITDVNSPVMFMSIENYNLIFLNILGNEGVFYEGIDGDGELFINLNFRVKNIDYNSDISVWLNNDEEVKINDLNLTADDVIVSQDIYENFIIPNEEELMLFNSLDSKIYNVKGYIKNDIEKDNLIYQNIYHTVFISDEVSQNLVKEFISISNRFMIINSDIDEYIDEADSLNINVKNAKDILYENYYENNQKDYSSIVFNLLILLASLIFLYFIIRTNMISRIYDIGVYRALGVKKRNVYKIFLIQTLFLTTISSFVGWLGTSIFILKINESGDFFFFPWFVALGSLIFIYLINIIVGMLPIFSLLRNKPVNILNKYDI
ncbi:MAG: ABC transporter ATP-binding protein/permease [Bacilli bacterium]|jgi:ABC-type lipoprotein export system ATPase subunit/ABC-type antimicrobial peptide transport system permease subunit|nr:ABC transporter ATP-binding protein/permease [Bacilli bacterium]